MPDQKSATPPPTSNAPTPVAAAPAPTQAADVHMADAISGASHANLPTSTLSVAQYKLCLSTIRQLKKQKDGAPFVLPVDTVALNIPHYNSIVKTPMDLSTVERKLVSSNPTKPDSNPENPRYFTADEFINDTRLIFTNCYTFNGPDHVISQMAKRLEESFDRGIKHLPPAVEVRQPRSQQPALPYSFSIAQGACEKRGITSTSAPSICTCAREEATTTSAVNICSCDTTDRRRFCCF
jgi:hypothetical protein